MTSCLLPSTENPFQNDGISDQWIVILRKFGEYLYYSCMHGFFFYFYFFLSVLFGYFDIVGDIRNTGDKVNFFLSSAGPRSAVGKAPDS